MCPGQRDATVKNRTADNPDVSLHLQCKMENETIKLTFLCSPYKLRRHLTAVSKTTSEQILVSYTSISRKYNQLIELKARRI